MTLQTSIKRSRSQTNRPKISVKIQKQLSSDTQIIEIQLMISLDVLNTKCILFVDFTKMHLVQH